MNSLESLSTLSNDALDMSEVRLCSPSKKPKPKKSPNAVQQTILLNPDIKEAFDAEAKRRGISQEDLGGLAVRKFLRAQRIKRELESR